LRASYRPACWLGRVWSPSTRKSGKGSRSASPRRPRLSPAQVASYRLQEPLDDDRRSPIGHHTFGKADPIDD
jgi:hypothetical protein